MIFINHVWLHICAIAWCRAAPGTMGRRGWGRGQDPGFWSRCQLRPHLLIRKTGAFGIFNDDCFDGFNQPFPTRGRVGNVQPHVRDHVCGKRQSHPEQPKQRPRLLRLKKVWPFPPESGTGICPPSLRLLSHWPQDCS